MERQTLSLRRYPMHFLAQIDDELQGEEAQVIGTKTSLALCIAALTAWSGLTSARANNEACWGLGKDDTERPDISCTSLTEAFILSMRGATRAEVLKAMNAGGRPTSHDGLHFISNAGMGKGWDGDINFTFGDNDRVAIISALVDGPNGSPGNMEFIWNADGFLCSDFPGHTNRCNRSAPGE